MCVCVCGGGGGGIELYREGRNKVLKKNETLLQSTVVELLCTL